MTQYFEHGICDHCKHEGRVLVTKKYHWWSMGYKITRLCYYCGLLKILKP